MLHDCIQIFKESLDEEEKLILDNYVPKDGTYLMVVMDEGEFTIIETLDIHYNKKTGQIEGENEDLYKDFQRLDYCCKLVEMNKPIDAKKIIHANNFLSFFVKKESLMTKKVTDEMIDGYYQILKNPIIKYEKKPKSREIYQMVEQDLGQPDQELIERIQLWIKKHLWNLDLDLSKKDYLKIFFVFSDQEKTIQIYKQEEKRYLIPNIYNNNDFNRMIDGHIYGLPNNNMGMNSKKPYLEHKSRVVKEPNLLSMDEVLDQNKFFDYLMGKASVGYVNVYVNLNNRKFEFYKNGEFAKDFKNGYFMRIQKGKELEIHSFDTVSAYRFKLREPFVLKQIIECSAENIKRFEPGYGIKENLLEMQELIDDVFFSKWLLNNYFTDSGDLSIKDGTVKFNLLTARDRLFNWFYKGNDNGIDRLLQNVSIALIKNSIVAGNYNKAKHQINLRWSLMDYFSKTNDMEELMEQVRDCLRNHINSKEEWEFDTDKEYYFAVGQLIKYYLSLSKGKSIPESLVNPFLNARNDEVIKKRLRYLYKRVNYAIDLKRDVRINKMISHIMGYETNAKVDQDMLISGLTGDLLIYESKKEEK